MFIVVGSIWTGGGMNRAGRTNLDAFKMAGAFADIDDGKSLWLDMDGIRRAGTFTGAAGNALLRIDNGNDF